MDNIFGDNPLMDLDEATCLLSGEFGKCLTETLISYATFITFGLLSPSGSYTYFGNGSGFFLRTPEKLMFVTAAHVFDSFIHYRKDHPEAVFFVGSHAFPIEERLIATGRTGQPNDVDIATFEISERELRHVFKKAATEYWPPNPPPEGCCLSFIGFPAQEIVRFNGSYGYGPYTGLVSAKYLTDRQIEIDTGHRDLSDAIVRGISPDINYSTGGMSGGPVFTVSYKVTSGIMFLRLGGVISEGRHERDQLFAERADSIRANGSIRT